VFNVILENKTKIFQVLNGAQQHLMGIVLGGGVKLEVSSDKSVAQKGHFLLGVFSSLDLPCQIYEPHTNLVYVIVFGNLVYSAQKVQQYFTSRYGNNCAVPKAPQMRVCKPEKNLNTNIYLNKFQAVLRESKLINDSCSRLP